MPTYTGNKWLNSIVNEIVAEFFTGSACLTGNDCQVIPASQKGFGYSDLVDRTNRYEIIVDLPGFEKEDIKIKYKDKRIYINATKKETKEVVQYLQHNRSRSHSFSKNYYFPSLVDATKITSKFVNGVLSIEAPKLEQKSDSLQINID